MNCKLAEIHGRVTGMVLKQMMPLLLIVFVLPLSAQDRVAGELDSSDTPLQNGAETADVDAMKNRIVFSGIQSIAIVAEELEAPVEFEEMLKAKWGGADDERSPIAILFDQLTSIGLLARQEDELSVNELRKLDEPAILFVRGSADSQEIDFAVAFLGVENGVARIVSRANGEQAIPLIDLATYFDGQAVVVSRDDLSGAGLVTGFVVRHAFIILVAGTCLVVIVYCGLTRRAFRVLPVHFSRAGLQVVAVVSIGLFVSMSAYIARGGRQIADVQGMLNPLRGDSVLYVFDTIQNVSDAATGPGFVDIDAEKLLELAADIENPLLWVDARVGDEYKTNHIKGAFSLPVLSTAKVRLGMAGIKKTQRLLVYCASSSCGRGRKCCGILSKIGFRNIFHFTNGWKELQDMSSTEFAKVRR